MCSVPDDCRERGADGNMGSYAIEQNRAEDVFCVNNPEYSRENNMIQSVTEQEIATYNERGYVVPDIQLSVVNNPIMLHIITMTTILMIYLLIILPLPNLDEAVTV